jgi:hypothetical protein
MFGPLLRKPPSPSGRQLSTDAAPPGYGETPLAHDELTALVPAVVEMLDKPIAKAAVYELDQGVLEDRRFHQGEIERSER